MADDRTPNADELASTTDRTGPGTTNATDLPRPEATVPDRPAAEPRSTESLRDDALKDTASNQDDETQAS